MDVALYWSLIGALLGYLASQRRGFSAVGGVIGGLLLGPFAFLMFFMSGILSSSEQQRKCPHCAEWIQQAAVVCKHCHKDVTAAPPRVMPIGANVGCPFCAKSVKVGEATCRHCGEAINWPATF